MFIHFYRSTAQAADDLRQSLLTNDLTLMHTRATSLLDDLDPVEPGDDTSGPRLDLGDVDGYEAYLAARIGVRDENDEEADYPEDRPDGLEDADTVYMALSVMCAVHNAMMTNLVRPGA